MLNEIVCILYKSTLHSSHKNQRGVYLNSKAWILFYKQSSINNVKWQAVSYGTITSNGVATAHNTKPPNDSQKPKEICIINPEGRVNKCHLKPQPCEESQLRNAQNERRQANGLRHHCNNGAAHGITPQAIEASPNINYK